MQLSDELAQRLLEAAPEAVLATDARGFIVFANRQLGSVFGHAHERLIGQNVECLLAARSHGAHHEHRRRLLSDAVRPPEEITSERLKLHGRHEEGAEFPIEISSTRVAGPKGPLILTFLRDASVEHALMQRLTLARGARHRLRDSARHELRQPLQALNLLTAAAARQADNDPALAPIIERQRDVLGTLTRLLESMLDAGGNARRPPRRTDDRSHGGPRDDTSSSSASPYPTRSSAASDAAAVGSSDRRRKRR